MKQKLGLVLEGGAMRGLFSAAILDVFLDEGIGLGIAEFLGFLKVLYPFCLVAFEALGKAFEQVAVAIAAVKPDALVGCLNGIVIHAYADLE